MQCEQKLSPCTFVFTYLDVLETVLGATVYLVNVVAGIDMSVITSTL